MENKIIKLNNDLYKLIFNGSLKMMGSREAIKSEAKYVYKFKDVEAALLEIETVKKGTLEFGALNRDFLYSTEG